MKHMSVEEFMRNPKLQNAWTSFEHAEIFLRKYHSLTIGARVDIANMSTKPKKEGSGQFKRLVQLIATIAAEAPAPTTLIVENVLNEHLDAHLIKRGWTCRPADSTFGSWPPSYSKPASECLEYAK